MKFSEVVFNLAQEEEPSPIRQNFNSSGVFKLNSLVTKPVISCDAMKRSTLVTAMKDKYIVRSRHDKIGALKFLPVN
jgi:hypothetical protein